MDGENAKKGTRAYSENRCVMKYAKRVWLHVTIDFPDGEKINHNQIAQTVKAAIHAANIPNVQHVVCDFQDVERAPVGEP